MTAGRKSVKLFYDVVSPYTWIAFETLCRYRAKWPIDLCLKPMFLGGVIMDSGNRPPGFVPRKGIYMVQDIERLKQVYKIPINQPSNPAEVMFEKGSLKAQRFLTAVNKIQPQFLEETSRQLWMKIWSQDKDITQPQVLKEAAMTAGMKEGDVDIALQESTQKHIKDTLKSVTDEACAYGAFGAPTIVVTGDNGQEHLVFGSDRMEVIAHLLGEKYEGPLAEMSKL